MNLYLMAKYKVISYYGKRYVESKPANQIIAIYYKILDSEKKNLYKDTQLSLFI